MRAHGPITSALGTPKHIRVVTTVMVVGPVMVVILIIAVVRVIPSYINAHTRAGCRYAVR